MGLLDDLKKQAEDQRPAGSSEPDAQSRDTLFQDHTDPGMVALHEFLNKLSEQLQTLKRSIELRFDMPGYGEIVGHIAPDFDIKFNTQNTIREINLNAICQIDTDRCPLRTIEGAAKVRTVSALFQKHHLTGLASVRKDANNVPVEAVFRAKGKIPVSAHFLASHDSPVLRMSFHNFDSLGDVSRSVPVEQLGEALFDNIGRFLLREENTLMREELPEAYREQLRKKVQQDQMKRRWEEMVLTQQEKEAEQAAMSSDDGSLKNKLLRQGQELGKKLSDRSWINDLVGRFRKKDNS